MEKHTRILKRMKALGLKQVDVVTKSNGHIGKTSISQYISGDGFPFSTRLVILAKILQTTEEWLTTGKGTELITVKNQNDPLMSDLPMNTYPVINWEASNQWSGNMDLASDVVGTYETTYKGNICFSLIIKSEAMAPEFKIGEKILVDTGITPRHNYYILINEGINTQPVVRKYIVDGDKFFIKTTNPDWPFKIEPIEDKHTIVGCIVEKWTGYL